MDSIIENRIISFVAESLSELLNLVFMQTGDIVIYQTEDGQTSIDVKLVHDSVWLTQRQKPIY